MTSWEIAVIVGAGFIPLFLQRIAELSKKMWFKTFITIFNILWYGAILRVVTIIANLNDTDIGTIINTLYKVYIVVGLVVICLVIVLSVLKIFNKDGQV